MKFHNSILLVTFLFLVIITLSKAQQERLYSPCNTTSNYTSGTQYQSNLNLTFTSLMTNSSSNTFYNTTSGQSPDQVYSLFQCRGDVSNQACQACVTTSTSVILQRCPNEKEAAIFYDDCWLRYANYRFFSTPSTVPKRSIISPSNISNPPLFNRRVGELMNNLSSSAAADDLRFSSGSIDFSGSLSIYGMAQCTRDLDENSCSVCLKEMVGEIPVCCGGKQGGRVMSMSCYVRYEIYAFEVNSSTTVQRVTPPPPLPPAIDGNSTARSSRKGAEKKKSSRTIAIATSTGIASLLTSAICISLLRRKFSAKRADIEGASLLIDLNSLRVATSDFSDSNKLGQGGFGTVYKGKLPNGKEVAVKRLLNSTGQGLDELRTEVESVAQLLHKNLVKLLGFCLEENEKLLVYEFLPNGALDSILFDQGDCSKLDWDQRFKIIVGIAEGLLYLHHDSQIRIIHRDMKAANILLDEDMNPKIADFGLAKLFYGSQTHGNTNRIAGTYGYMAPEYVRHGNFSTKTDVFSYGVLVLEIVSGRRNSSFGESTNLLSHTWELWTMSTPLELVDPALGDQWRGSEALQCIQIGLLCVQQYAATRPTMTEVAAWLNNPNTTCALPSRPAFYVGRVRSAEADVLNNINGSLSGTDSDQSTHRRLQHSLNEVTISKLDPR